MKKTTLVSRPKYWNQPNKPKKTATTDQNQQKIKDSDAKHFNKKVLALQRQIMKARWNDNV